MIKIEHLDAINAPLGVSIVDGWGTIRVFSATATSMQVCLPEPDDLSKIRLTIDLQKCEGDVWSATSREIQLGTQYVLRADGPGGAKDDFKPEVNLIDPYARGVSRQSARDYVNVVTSSAFDWQGVEKPNTALAESVIYEAHARGLTRANESLPDEMRGTYAALGHPSTIAHLKNLGITALELLPIQMFISEPRLMNMGLINYWGYNTINFFAPHPRYASSSAITAGPQAVIDELKTAIRELHRAGIEVILDVVYNHTAEGGYRGLNYSFRGLDNATYYRQDDQGNYIDTTGCGNSLDFSQPIVRRLALDSLKYWTQEFQIDGFRFDLATTLARDEHNQFNPNHEFLQALQDDPAFEKSKLIVEPWDVGLGGWQTGNFGPRFSEWDDRYRDSVRRFWLSDVASARNTGHYSNGVADLATRLAGSADLFDSPAGTSGSINFVTAHDGFTLRDLVSYNVKHNQNNGESNRDGNSNNYSFNHGAEGETSDKEIKITRRRAMRNLLATLIFSSGVPMLTAGDERGKTQLGNNNSYCQDNVSSWVNHKLTKHEKELQEVTAELLKIRRENFVLHSNKFAHTEPPTGDKDQMLWFGADGQIMTEEQWNDPNCRTISRFSASLGPGGQVSQLLLVIHGAESTINLTLPKIDGVTELTRIWDSALDPAKQLPQKVAAGSQIVMTATSMQLYRLH